MFSLRNKSYGNILLMIIIFILAGAFASTAKNAGAIDAMVNLTMSVIPGRFLLAGMFIASCVVSFAVGTSMGTIAALMPVAVGIATETGIDMATMAAAVVGGAFFGDNMSFISDTTIAATQALDCELHEKFRANIRVAAPAVLIVLVLYCFLGSGEALPFESHHPELVKLIPYFVVIVLAFMRVNVLLILSLALLLNLGAGLVSGSAGFMSWLNAAWQGIVGMGLVIAITIIAGGLLGLVTHFGLLDSMMNALARRLKGPKSAEFCIAALVSTANVFTANNTVAIIATGGIAKDICKRFKLRPRKVASILDTFSCLVQGILPYGAQLLMASSLAGIGTTAIIARLYYPLTLGICAVFGILIGDSVKED